MFTNKIQVREMTQRPRGMTGRSLLVTAALVGAICLPSLAKADSDDNAHYRQINLVSDILGAAQLQDTNLVNAWGISFRPGSPFWISDNGRGRVTLYSVTNDPSGSPLVNQQGLVVTIPGEGNPTGQAFNPTTGFHSNLFLFASEDGTISGWRPALGASAEVLVTRSNAVYKGMTLATNASGPLLLLANFSEATIDAYDSNLGLVGQFSDPNLPSGYAPFNVQLIAGTVFVTFAKQDALKHDDDPARGRGAIDMFDPETGRLHRFAAGKLAGGRVREMNSPWGMALAPSTFGKHANQLLVGNFGSGTIMAFDAHGHFRGLLSGVEECPVIIDGLWGLSFGAGGSTGVGTDLYFTAGPFGESHGMFGVLQAVSEKDNDESQDHD